MLSEAINLMEDEESKVCLERVFNFRCSRGIEYASFQHGDDQYFNEITMRGREKVGCYIDIGAFDGANLLELEALTNVDCAFLFGPTSNNFQKILAAKIHSNWKIVHLPMAISNETRLLSFNGAQGESSRSAKWYVFSSLLDKLIPPHLRVDFIKLDVEEQS